jgi:CHAT domain-containing protein/tetratricopeptide (TPR) repeat protein
MRRWRWWGVVGVGVAVAVGGVGSARAQGSPGGAKANPIELQQAEQLNRRAITLLRAGKYDEALPFARQALAIREKELGLDHPNVAQSLGNLAVLYKEKGEYRRAEPLFRRALTINEKTLGSEDLAVALSLNNLGALYWAQGELGRAEPILRRALDIREKALGPRHPEVAQSLNNIAELYRARGEYERAEPLYLRAVDLREKALEPDPPELANFLNNLALLYRAKGEYGRAEPLYLRALALREKALGPDHPAVAQSLNNLAALHRAKGEYGRSEPLFLRALAINEKALGPDHPEVATSLNSLAELYREKGEYSRAEPLYQRALTIDEKALGPDHPALATYLNNLALLHDSKGDYERAEPLYQRALTIDKKALGPNHPDVAISLNNLAALYRTKGEYGRAEPLYQSALAIKEKALGSDHPAVAISLNNLAELSWVMGRLPNAVRFFRRAQDVEEKTLTLLVSAGSEAQNLLYVAQFAGGHNSAIDLSLQDRGAASAGLALTTILRRKGRALDATSGSVRALRARLGPEEQKLLDELNATRRRFATLILRGPGPTPLDAYKNDLGALRSQIQDHEAAISKRSAIFGAQQQQVTVATVQAALPDTTVLIEWVAYQPLNLKARTDTEKWAPPRYAACILPNHGAPTCLDLGDLKSIDADIHTLRAALRRPASTDVPLLARSLEARIMAPVRALLGNTRRVYLSPDGALNLVPFAALPDETGHPLIERYSFTYLTSGRDLLRLAAHLPAEQPPLILANPDFDRGATPGAARFPPLLHAEEEAAAASRVFPGAPAPVLTFDQATKATLLKAHGPRLLHIGTHGFFEPITCSPTPDTTALTNPLLQSGIALAGANACASDHDDKGILTAFEAAGLDLYGTKLAVLSACQTGVGDAKAGDGVYGLRRALVLAGAETQVMSLWPIEGAATSTLLKAYYERLAKGEGRSEAMRQVQLAMLHTPGKEHPYYWAPFIVSGDDRTMEDKAVEPDLRVHPGGACTCRMGEEVPDDKPVWLAVAAALGWMRRRATRQPRRRHEAKAASGAICGRLRACSKTTPSCACAVDSRPRQSDSGSCCERREHSPSRP